ncbi:transposase [Streptomyces sp. SID3343]|uniref:transposase n=1 Tax=Streptomyces sp. SID3343 TaxID=2690260 RepID=UPI001F0309E0|nr:transposase [Streptomyces sp. SID3343]
MIPGETAGAARCRSKDAFARFNGTAPIPVRFSNKVRIRLNRGGNRTINTALHLAAVTRARGDGAAYYARQLAADKTPRKLSDSCGAVSPTGSIAPC